ncbi:MAG: phosphotransferase [Thermomicrobiales bacterium]
MASALPWHAPGWLPAISAWLEDELRRQGRAPCGLVTLVQARPWSAVLRMPTSSGDCYGKAVAPALAHEVALTAALAVWRSADVPQVLAADQSRGWLLLADAGVQLRGLLQAPSDIQHWLAVLPRYAELQRDLAARRAELLSLGAFDRRLATLPAQYSALLADTAMLRLDEPDGLTTAEHRQLVDLGPRIAGWCAELAAYGLPETLHHDDFHDGNIFVRAGRYVFADWGESCVAHPFFTLVVTLRSVAYRLGLAAADPALARLRDAYLEPWTHNASRADLLAASALAKRLGMICRALTWRQVLAAVPPADRAAHADAVPGWLGEFAAAVA